MRDWLIVAAAGIGTYALRASLVVVFGRFETPRIVERAARYVAPAVMAAIAASELAAPAGRLDLPNLQLVAALVGGVVAWWTENLPATVGTGLLAYFLLRALT